MIVKIKIDDKTLPRVLKSFKLVYPSFYLNNKSEIEWMRYCMENYINKIVSMAEYIREK